MMSPSRTRGRSPGRASAWGLVMLLALTALGGCVRPGFDRSAMLGTVVDSIIVPRHVDLTREAEALVESAEAFAADPGAEELGSLRRQWLMTALAWKRVEPFRFPGLLLIHNAIEKRPARVEFIEEQVAEVSDEPPTSADIEMLGSTSRGLSAIEYLIFDSPEHTAPVAESFADPARGAYLVALATNLADKTAELHRFWTPEGDDYATTFRENDAEGADVNGSISLLANRLIEIYEVVMQMRLGLPMGRTTDGVPDPMAVESPATGESLALMTAVLESLSSAFEAGLDDYLDYLHRGPEEDRLSVAIVRQFDAVMSSLEQVDGPLQAAVVDDPEAVMAAYEAMRELLVLLKTDMSAQLGITVTFSDSDGD